MWCTKRYSDVCKDIIIVIKNQILLTNIAVFVQLYFIFRATMVLSCQSAIYVVVSGQSASCILQVAKLIRLISTEGFIKSWYCEIIKDVKNIYHSFDKCLLQSWKIFITALIIFWEYCLTVSEAAADDIQNYCRRVQNDWKQCSELPQTTLKYTPDAVQTRHLIFVYWYSAIAKGHVCVRRTCPFSLHVVKEMRVSCRLRCSRKADFRSRRPFPFGCLSSCSSSHCQSSR